MCCTKFWLWFFVCSLPSAIDGGENSCKMEGDSDFDRVFESKSRRALSNALNELYNTIDRDNNNR